MAPRHKRREEWRQTKTGTWTRSLGHRGFRVRLFENVKGGFFYRDVRRPDGTRDRATLGTRDRGEAEALGKQLLAALLAGGEPTTCAATPVRRTVPLGQLCDRFVRECPMFLDNDPHVQSDTRIRLAILRAVLGEVRDVQTLTRNDVQQYEARRKAGGIRFGTSKVTKASRQRSVQADLKLLKQVLYWACTVCRADGTPLLERNPLAGVSVKGEHDVRRPVASQERFEATRVAMQQRQQRYAEEARRTESQPERRRAEARQQTWVRAELALILLEATGRRRGSIMGLRWDDFDFVGHRITWRAERDKKRKTWVVAYPASLFESVREFQRRLGVVGGYVFPRRKNAERPARRELLSQWLRIAEQDAGLPKLNGGTCHPYRRKWRTERAHHPIKAVAVAGGWTDFDTMLRCYDQPDEADVLAVTSETRKRRELLSSPAAAASG